MLAAMGLAVTPELAKGAGVQMADVSMLKNNAKAGGYGAFLFHLKFWYLVFCGWQAFLAGNGMDVPCIGFVLLCVNLTCLTYS